LSNFLEEENDHRPSKKQRAKTSSIRAKLASSKEMGKSKVTVFFFIIVDFGVHL
jgi:hypothetical protein